jgi:hypothetical protein
MFTRGSSKERSSTRKVTPPSPSYMSNEQFGMHDLMASPRADAGTFYISASCLHVP